MAAKQRNSRRRDVVAEGADVEPSRAASVGPVRRPNARRQSRATPFLSAVPLLRAKIHEDGVIPETERSRSARRRDARYRRLLAGADLFSAAFAVWFGTTVLGEDNLRPLVLLMAPLVILVAKTGRLYERDEHVLSKTTLDEAPSLFRVATLFAILTWLTEDIFIVGTLGQTQVLGLWGLLFSLMFLGRTAARTIAGATSPPERCLVLGDPESAEWVERKLAASPHVRALVLGRVSLDEGSEEDARAAVPLLGALDLLGLVIEEHDIERVVVAPASSDSEQILDLIRLVKSLGVSVSLLPRLFEAVESSVEFDDIEGLMLLGVRRYGLSRSSRALKRATDVAGAGLGLLAIAPLLAMIVLAVKLTSSGPVLFRQRRVGRADVEFEMLKFRTMVDGADALKAELRCRNEAEGLFKIADDPRITTVGGFLRKTSLDELPQLFNVLRGEMSLVGPRPLVLDEDRSIEGWQRHRLQLSPGMTGLWQIFGSARIPMHEMVKIDWLYGANWSLWLDVKVLLRTVPIVLRRRGL